MTDGEWRRDLLEALKELAGIVRALELRVEKLEGADADGPHDDPSCSPSITDV